MRCNRKSPNSGGFVPFLPMSGPLLKNSFEPLFRRHARPADAPYSLSHVYDQTDRLSSGFGLDRWKLQNNMVHIIVVPAGLFRKQELNCEKNRWTMTAN